LDEKSQMKTIKFAKSKRKSGHEASVSALMTSVLAGILAVFSLASIIPFASALNMNDWSDEILVSSSSDGVSHPFTFTDIQENAYVMWQDNSSGNYQIFMKKFDSDGIALTSALLLVDSAGDAKNPSATIDAYERIVLVWEDTRDGNNEIYFKMLSMNGTELYPDARITNTLGDSLSPAVESYMNYVYLLWSDNTSGNFRLYQERIDFSVPSLTINAPLNGSSFNTSSIQLDATFGENVSAWYVLDGDSSGTINNTLVLSTLMENVTAGAHTLTVYCEDSFSTINQSSVTFNVNDLEPPAFTDINNITVQPSEQMLYDINATDLNGISCFTVNNTANFNIDCSGILSNITGLAVETPYALNITVNDTSNNKNSQIITVLVSDTIPPTVILSNDHLDLIVRDNNSITIIANFSEPMESFPAVSINYSNETCINITSDMNPASSSDYNYAWDVPALCDGTATITVSGTDLYDNAYADSEEIVFTIDNTAPLIAEATPVPAITKDNTPNYEFNSTEAGTITYGGSCNSAATIADVGSNIITFDPLSEGAHNNCTIIVTDAAGSPSNALIISPFLIDTQGPTFTNIQNKIMLDNTSLSYDIDATDINSISCFAVNDTLAFNIDCLGVLTNITSLDLGYYWLNISVNDSLNNINSKVIFINVVNSSLPLSDTTPPTVILSSNHTDNITGEFDSIIVYADFSESMTANPEITITYSNSACSNINVEMAFVSNSSYQYIWDVPALCDGTATITVSGTDLYDNAYADSDEIVFTIDNTAPIILEMTRVADLINTDTPNYEFNSTEAGTITYGGSCNSAATIADVGSNIITFDPLSEGAHNNCTIIVTDSAGNPSNTLAVSSFFVDTIPPLVDAGSNRTANNVFIQVATATDSGSGIASYSWTMESGSGIITFGSSDELNTTISADGDNTYVIRLSVSDLAGNSGYDEMTLTWRATAPVIDYAVLSPEEIIVNGTFAVTAKGVNGQPGELLVYAVIEDILQSRVNLTDMGDSVYSAEVTPTDYSEGDYTLYIYFEDLFGNNASVAKTFSIKEVTAVVGTYLDESADIVANESANISDSGLGISLDINATESMNTTISIIQTTSAENTDSFGLLDLGKFITIDAPELEGKLNSVIIKVDYNDSDVTALAIDESTLRLYYYNTASATWIKYDGNDGFAPDGGVNTTEDYVWALTDHFSIWGIFGGTFEEETALSEGGHGSRCKSEWNCTSWSECDNRVKTRTCALNYPTCDPRTVKPNESQSCEMPVVEDIPVTTTTMPETDQIEAPVQNITGNATPPGMRNSIIGIIIMLLSVGLGLGLFFFLKKNKK
jgi:hypothetical protein